MRYSNNEIAQYFVSFFTRTRSFDLHTCLIDLVIRGRARRLLCKEHENFRESKEGTPKERFDEIDAKNINKERAGRRNMKDRF